MAKIIELKGLRFNSNKQHGCEPPVLIQRVSEFVATIGFRKDCFTVQLIEPALRGSLRGDYHWKLYKVEDSYSALHVTYAIQVDNGYPDDEVVVVMREKLGVMAEKLYSYEARIRPRHLSVSDLTRVPDYSSSNDLTISATTSSHLKAAGLASVADLIMKSRSEICEIRGMSTSEVFRLEKGLAARNLFLLHEPIPNWKEGEQ